MQGVILNNPRKPQAHDMTLILPVGAIEEHAPFRCTICEARFTRHQAELYERHVGACARAHIDEIRANAPSVRHAGTPFDPLNWDAEVDAHMLAVGRRMLAEGRFEVKPHERAGHS